MEHQEVPPDHFAVGKDRLGKVGCGVGANGGRPLGRGLGLGSTGVPRVRGRHLEVQQEDFWTVRTITPSHVSCPEGHVRQTGDEKFCSDCGGQFGNWQKQRIICNPHFAKLIGDDDPKGRAGEAWNPERVRALDEQANLSVFGRPELKLFCIDSREDTTGDTPQSRALGFQVTEVLNIEEFSKPLPFGCEESTLEYWFDECRRLGTLLGIDRPPRLYLHTRCG